MVPFKEKAKQLVCACVLTLLLNSVWLCIYVWWRNRVFFSAVCVSFTRLRGLLCPIIKRWPSDIGFGYIFLKCESICVSLLVKKRKTLLLFFLVYFRFVTMKRHKQTSNGMAVAMTVRQSNPIGHFIEWKQQNLPWCFLLFLVHSQAGVSLRCMEAVWCFSMSYFFMLGHWRGRWRVRFKARKRNHWSVCQCLCLCLGFPLSPFPHTHNSKPLHSRHYTLSLAYLLFPFTLPVSPSPTLKVQFKSAQLSLYPAFSLYTCQTFTLLPVFVLQSGFWRGPSGRRGGGKPIRWGADGRSFWAAKKERLWYWIQDFPLEPRRLCKLYLEEVCFKCTCCAITQTAFERRRCVLVCELFLYCALSFFLFLSLHAFVIVTKFNQHFRFHMSPGCSVFRS